MTGKLSFKGNLEVKLILGPESIAKLIAARNDAKKAKNFAKADEIRGQLEANGIVLEDKAGGVTEWRRK